MLIQGLITIIFVTVVCMIDFSVFFLKEDTEKLLYYDETTEESVEASNEEVKEEKDDNTVTEAGRKSEDVAEDFVDDFEEVPSADIDVAALARDLVRDVQEDAKRDG